MKTLQLVVILSFLFSSLTISQPDLGYLTTAQLELYNEHIKGGQPDNDTLFIRNAYVLNYNTNYRIPNWVAFHIIPDYLNTPERKSRFISFRTDPEVTDAVDTEEYNGLSSSKGYDRGHLAPYKIMGGDRDSDGIYAVYGSVNSDEDEEQTIFQGNYMSNITPQHDRAINGSGGLWYNLERWIQEDIVESHNKELWVYAGSIVIDKLDFEGVGRNNSIVVPDMFYQILIMQNSGSSPPHVLAFLFPHFKNKLDRPTNDIFKYLVPVDYIEAITGLDFLNVFSETEQQGIEANINIQPWEDFIDD
jgi:endonuclease G